MRRGAVLAFVLVATGPAAAETWRGLEVTAEDRCSEYRQSDYSYNRQRLLHVLMDRDGHWLRYTDRIFESEHDVDIEHIVARSEAHDSGLCAAGVHVRRLFANDTLNQVLAGSRLNRVDKGNKDAGEWMPPENTCWFASTVVKVKRRYALTVDARERDWLDAVLVACSPE